MSVDKQINGGGAPRLALDSQLRLYNRSYRRRLRKHARSSSRFTDLIYSYPAAAFVIAAHHGNPMKRAGASKLVEDGAGLRAIADCLELPFWTRKLPPHCFTGGFAKLPGSASFNRQIVNLIPKDAAATAMWFKWVLKANALCHEDFALWVARQKIWDVMSDDPDILLPMAAYVWFGDAAGTKARGFIELQWTPALSFRKTWEAARAWVLRMLLEDCQDRSGQTGRWFVEQRASGFRIIPLRQMAELQDEGRCMGNCVADYASAVASGNCLIYSVRRGNNHVATLEVNPGHKMDGSAIVAQLLGPNNESVNEAISRAVQSWIKRQGPYPFVAAGKFALAGFNRREWDKLWAPYWDARGNPDAARRQRNDPAPIEMHKALEALAYYA